VALLAVFIGHHFANKYNGGCHADRAMAAVQRLSSEATHFVAMAHDLLGESSTVAVPELAMAGAQGHFASLEADVARQQDACARLEAQRARILALQQIYPRVRVVCPRQSVSLEVPQTPTVFHEGTI
jgi:hypothetical protein